MRTVLRIGFGFILTLGFALPVHAEDKPTVDFERDILPILKERCHKCHDAGKQRSGYRLDVRSLALRGGESGQTAIVSGASGRSELIRRVTSTDAAIAMPSGGEKLTAAQIKLLRDWIDAGAKWPDSLAGVDPKQHWAFQPPKRPPLPEVKNAAWVRNDIDRFVLARLEKEGLSPSPEADRLTLMRRLYLDLTGLPPTIEEIEAFEKSAIRNPQSAIEDLVDRLLASPHYGERWARHWLDVARYADSDGFEKDKSRQVWFYRDWVINSLNRDLPYNQFIIEQIAGDLLLNATQDQIAATGYLRNSMINEEGGVDPEQFRMEAMFDRMDAVGKGVLGLTIQCAQCHNHKFDPLTQAEYYRMFAFLNNCHEANIAVYTPEEQKRRADIFGQIQAIEDDLRKGHADWQKQLAAWEEKVKKNQPRWHVVKPELDASGGQKHYLLEDGSVLAQGYAPTKHTTDFTVRTDLPEITAVRLELLNDPNLPLGGPGRSIYGLCALTEFQVVAAPADKPNQTKEVKIVRAAAEVNPAEKPLEKIFDDKSNRKRVTGPIDYAIDAKDDTAWSIDIGPGRSNQPRQAVFVFEIPIAFPKGAVLTFKLHQKHGGWNSDDNQNNNLGRFRFAVTDDTGPDADLLPLQVTEILSIPTKERTAAQTVTMFSYYCTTVREWKDANEKIESLWQQHPVGSSQLVLQEREKRRPTHILKRGDFLKPGERVEPGVASWLHPLPEGDAPDRLRFARWLADERSPTTARVMVNRVWQAYFGNGLVNTPEDFGTQSEPPSHPELLDWLAVEFLTPEASGGKMASGGRQAPGWSLKTLHKLIVTSATYRQSSRVSPELLRRDPYNRLLARGPRFRVEAEGVRDIALAASGLLNRKIGGPSVFPPQPAFLMQPPASYGPKVWNEDTGPDRYRRGLYVFRFRSVPYPVMQTFDAPNGDAACVRRARTNTPLQALTALNEPMFMECARSLGLLIVKEGGKTDEERVTYAFRRCLARKPTAEEMNVLLSLLAKQRERFTKPDAKPLELAANDPAKPPPLPEGTTPAELAAWTVVARVLLNLDETITKE